jgi:flagellar basal body-associated protein FliL
MAFDGFLKTAGLIVVAAVAGAGATIGAQMFLPHQGIGMPARLPPPPPPKPVLFANIADITVSIPPVTGAAATSYLQFAVQFSTTDPNALTMFDQLQPIIKADIISLLMNETTHALQDPRTRADLLQNCLDISNQVLAQKADYVPATPFSAAYITNLVVQD